MALIGATTMVGTFALPAIAPAADGGRFHDARGDARGDARENSRDARDRDDHRYDDRARDDNRRYDDSHERAKTDVHVDINIGRPRYEPVYEDRTTRLWVEPVYRTVCDRVWVEPVYQTVCDRVWEPDRFESRDVVYREYGRKVIRQERVLVEPGHWRDVERQILVREGHWDNIDRQELVTPGHWETRIERVQVGESRSNPVFDLFTRFSR